MPRLSDLSKLVTPTLLRRFEGEAELEGGDGRYYGCILRPDGDLLVHHPFAPALAPEQLMWAADVLKFLNRELHFDGAWVVVFTHPNPINVLEANPHPQFGRYVLLWLDQDGDVQIPIEWCENEGELAAFTDVLLAGLENVAQCAAYAHAIWKDAMKALDARPHEKFKRAQGEIAPSARH